MVAHGQKREGGFGGCQIKSCKETTDKSGLRFVESLQLYIREKNTFLHVDEEKSGRARSGSAPPRVNSQVFCQWKDDSTTHGEVSAQETISGPTSSGTPSDLASNSETELELRAEWEQSRSGRRVAVRPLDPEVTTLVLRNIPARYTVETLLPEWEDETDIDFIHLPYNIHKQRCCGLAFVNFVTPEAALDFQARKHRTYLRHGCAKHLDVAAAEVQGLTANLMNFRGGRKIHRAPFVELLPAIFRGAERLSTDDVQELLGLPKVTLRSISVSGRAGRR